MYNYQRIHHFLWDDLTPDLTPGCNNYYVLFTHENLRMSWQNLNFVALINGTFIYIAHIYLNGIRKFIRGTNDMKS